MRIAGGPRPHASGRRGHRWPAVTALLLWSLLAPACATGSHTSFTSLDAADRQASTWLDETVDEVFPADLPRRKTSAGRQTCTTSADFAELDREVWVTVAPEDVDRYTAASFAALTRRFAQPGVTPATAPRAPGPGSPSWELGLGGDGFKVEIVGNRTPPPDPYVRIRITTPCIKTA